MSKEAIQQEPPIQEKIQVILSKPDALDDSELMSLSGLLYQINYIDNISFLGFIGSCTNKQLEKLESIPKEKLTYTMNTFIGHLCYYGTNNGEESIRCDLAKSFDHFMRAKDYPPAQNKIGSIYTIFACDRNGYVKDGIATEEQKAEFVTMCREAEKFLKLAICNGFNPAKVKLTQLYANVTEYKFAKPSPLTKQSSVPFEVPNATPAVKPPVVSEAPAVAPEPPQTGPKPMLPFIKKQNQELRELKATIAEAYDRGRRSASTCRPTSPASSSSGRGL